MATIFLWQYTMCYTMCNAGGLRACCIVLKTKYLLLKIMTILRISCEIFYSKLVHLWYETVQYMMHPKRLVFSQRQGRMLCLEGTNKYVYLYIYTRHMARLTH